MMCFHALYFLIFLYELGRMDHTWSEAQLYPESFHYGMTQWLCHIHVSQILWPWKNSDINHTPKYFMPIFTLQLSCLHQLAVEPQWHFAANTSVSQGLSVRLRFAVFVIFLTSFSPVVESFSELIYDWQQFANTTFPGFQNSKARTSREVPSIKNACPIFFYHCRVLKIRVIRLTLLTSIVEWILMGQFWYLTRPQTNIIQVTLLNSLFQIFVFYHCLFCVFSLLRFTKSISKEYVYVNNCLVKFCAAVAYMFFNNKLFYKKPSTRDPQILKKQN